jgi:hypothetical protein
MWAISSTFFMRSLRLVALGVSLIGLSAAGCSVLLSTAEPTQCTTTRDCDANPSFRNRVCEEGFCVIPKVPIEPVTNDAGDGCVSSELCTQANSNRASVCKKAGGPCTPWQTEQCPYVSGAWSDPNAIVIGSILPLTARQFNGSLTPVPYMARVRRAIDLGLEELTTELPGGVPFGNGPPRPFAIVHCDSSFDDETARSAFRHLTEVVGVQSMIVGVDADLAAVTPLATTTKTAIACSDCVGPLPAGPLAWRIIPPLTLEAPMAAWRVAQLEAQIKAGPTPPATIKVAVLLEPGRAPEAFTAALQEKLRFNGKTVTENGSSFMIVKPEDPLKTSVFHAKHADTIVAFEPDVIVVAMGSDLPVHYIPLIEAKWPVGRARPHYVTTNLNFEVEPFDKVLTPAADDDLRKRISGTRPGYAQDLQSNITAYELRFKQAYNFQPPDGNHSGYDAFYALAYAVLGSAVQPVHDGPHVSAGFERLRSGTAIDFGPTQIGLAVALLGQPTANIDVRGLWSHLDWNVATRDLQSDVSMYCFQRAPDGSLVAKPDAGPHLQTSTGIVTGAYVCD